VPLIFGIMTSDIIISDVMMPKMSGTDMCRIIKADIDLCHIPVILLTALSASESKLEGLNTNADDYVTKPFESTLLLARVDNLLRLRRILRKQFEKQPIAEVDMSIVNPMDRDLLKRTTEAIEKHIDDLEFDIPALCREVGVSRSLFFNKFKTLTGMTPNSFILNYRLKYAAALLTAQPHLSIADVADKSGFATPIYFSRCFRKQFGVSPLAYRKGTTDSEPIGE
ncbi:MAG: DNA-binding response regulator, partial [Paramuribaculum sp.]|nr:DNA-binding response regulator [Paramuribaculum sp.]